MRVRASSASAVVVSLLVNDVFAAVHGRHEYFHRKRTQLDVTTTEDIIETKTEVVYVTVEWPGGKTLGVQYPSDTSTPAAPATVPAFTAAPAGSSVTDTFVKPSTVAAVVHASSSSVSEAQFVQKPKTTSTPPVIPTTLATVAKIASTQPATVPTPSPVSQSNSSKKRGLAYTDASDTSIFTGGNSQVSWAYNWGQTGSGVAAGLEYIPTLWNNDPSRTGPWAADASKAIAAGARHLFSFNEPDLGSQANMDVSTAVSAYKQYIQPFAGKAQLGAPAVTNGGGSMGLQYMQNFISSCSGCTIDFVNIHWYDSATNFGYFKSHVEQAHTLSGGRPVWITEFAGSGSVEEQNAFLQVVIPWLDAQSYVQGYAYFMVEDGVLLSGNSLSTLGSTFTDYTSSTISPLIANA